MAAIVIVEGRADGKPEVRKATKAWIVCILGRSRGTIKPSSSQAKTRVLRRYRQLPSLHGYGACTVNREHNSRNCSQSFTRLYVIWLPRQQSDALATVRFDCRLSVRAGSSSGGGSSAAPLSGVGSTRAYGRPRRPTGAALSEVFRVDGGSPVHAVGRALTWRVTLLPPAIVTHRRYSLKAMLPLATGVPRRKMSVTHS
jgi:hypothetical protein